MSQSQTIHVLTGCTAVGKTAAALGWAKANDAEIVSCDALLFYRGMDVGTAKPTREEREQVPHHLVDLGPVTEGMDVARFLELAIAAVAEIQSRGKRVLVTGGSGFYLKAFFSPVVDGVVVSSGIKDEVARIEQSEGVVGLSMRLVDVSPDCRGAVDLDNPRRVARALERCLASGLSVTELKERFEQQSNPLIAAAKELVVLERDKEELAGRIARRVDIMLEDGLIAEVERLRGLGIDANPTAASAIGYRETLAYLKGELAYEALASTIATNTRRLAKKQRTWFRGQLPQGNIIRLEEGGELDVVNLFA